MLGVTAARRPRQSTGYPNENPTPALRQAVAKSWVAPAVSQRTNTFGASSLSGSGRHRGGRDANACASTVMWSAAVLDPARPVRSSPARASPPAISGGARKAHSRGGPQGFFPGRGPPSLVLEWSLTQGAAVTLFRHCPGSG